MCLFFPMTLDKVELQEAEGFYTKIRDTVDSTYCSSYPKKNALFDLRDIFYWHKKLFQSSC